MMLKIFSNRSICRAYFLTACAMVAVPGCGDGSVRGAGSIDVPKESRKSYVPSQYLPPKYEPKPEAPAKAP